MKLPNLHFLTFMFLSISSILIYFPLRKELNAIRKRQHYYATLNNVLSDQNINTITSPYSVTTRTVLRITLLMFRSSIISFLIGIIPSSLLIIFALPCRKHNETVQNLNNEPFKDFITFEIVKVVVYSLCIILSCWFLYGILRCRIVKKLQSKIDYCIVNYGTSGHVLCSIILIYTRVTNISRETNRPSYYQFHALSIASNTLLVLQLAFQKFVIVELLHRDIKTYCQRYINPCLILSLINFACCYMNILEFESPIERFELENVIVWKFMRNLIIPISILNRMHGFSFLFNAFIISINSEWFNNLMPD